MINIQSNLIKLKYLRKLHFQIYNLNRFVYIYLVYVVLGSFSYLWNQLQARNWPICNIYIFFSIFFMLYL